MEMKMHKMKDIETMIVNNEIYKDLLFKYIRYTKNISCAIYEHITCVCVCALKER